MFIAFNINHSSILPLMALNSLYCADVPLSNYSLIHSTAKQQAKRKPWIQPETFVMIEKKRECKRDSEEYLKTTVRKMLRQDRNTHLTTVCEKMEEHQRRNRTKDIFAGHSVLVNRLTKQACPSVRAVKSESSETLTEQAEILDRRKNYCETLYSTCEPVEEMKLDGEREPTPTYEEVKKALKSMRTGKAEGPDETMHKIIILCIAPVTVSRPSFRSSAGISSGPSAFPVLIDLSAFFTFSYVGVGSRSPSSSTSGKPESG